MGFSPTDLLDEIKELQRALKRESKEFAHECGVSVGLEDSDELDTLEHMYGNIVTITRVYSWLREAGIDHDEAKEMSRSLVHEIGVGLEVRAYFGGTDHWLSSYQDDGNLNKDMFNNALAEDMALDYLEKYRDTPPPTMDMDLKREAFLTILPALQDGRAIIDPHAPDNPLYTQSSTEQALFGASASASDARDQVVSAYENAAATMERLSSLSNLGNILDNLPVPIASTFLSVLKLTDVPDGTDLSPNATHGAAARDANDILKR